MLSRERRRLRLCPARAAYGACRGPAELAKSVKLSPRKMPPGYNRLIT